MSTLSPLRLASALGLFTIISTSVFASAQEAPARRRGGGPRRPAAAEVAPACLPNCRSGFTCVVGRCVSKCNPLCGEGERCTDEGECEPAPEPASSAPRRAATPPPKARATPAANERGGAGERGGAAGPGAGERGGAAGPGAGERGVAAGPGAGERSGAAGPEASDGTGAATGEGEAPTSDDAPPRSSLSTLPAPGARRHDGLFLRLGLGPSLYHASYVDVSATGVGGTYEFALGGTLGKGVVVGGMINPKVLAVSDLDLQVMLLSFAGPFVDYYPDPSKGVHFQGAAGVASASYRNHLSGTFELMAGAGKEWWVGEQWSVGLLGRLSYLNPRLTFGSSDANDTQSKTSLFVLSGLVTFTYH